MKKIYLITILFILTTLFLTTDVSAQDSSINSSDSFTIPITDGQLNIYPSSGAGDNNYSLCTLEIEKVSNGTVTKPTIWIYGDSTVCNYYNVEDTYAHGWGQLINKYIDTDKYDIRNMAINGMSAKKLVDHDSFSLSEFYGKSGDILIISIGINDYIEDTKNNRDSSGYVAAVTDMVRRAKAKGMTVYLVKQQGLLNDNRKYPVIIKQWYSEEIESIAKSESVNIIDLFRPWLELCLEKTYYGVSAYYQTNSDGKTNEIHPNKEGADILAKMAVDQIFPSPKSEPEDISDMYDDQFSSSTTVIYQTEVSEGPISNPHKGFVMEVTDPSQFESSYRYGIGGSYDNHAWDVVSVCYDVLFWKDLNPEEGVYKWDDIDDMPEACEKHGMTCHQ